MKTICFSREQLSIMLYCLIASKDKIDPSEHIKIDELVEMLNK
jgi:hypothetical protein